MNFKSSIFILPLLTIACAHEPLPELVTARNVHDNLTQSEAPQLVPAEVYSAKKALIRAEKAHERDNDSAQTRDFAYIATRSAQIAAARAEQAKAEAELRQASEDRVATLHAQSEAAQRKLDATREALELEGKALEQKDTEIARIEKERAELQSQLESTLDEFAKLSERADETVLTLSGSVLFQVDSADLLPSAHERLEEVAKVLAEYDDRKIIVEGHTDSTGSDSYNQRLSHQRAQTVQQFLISRGVTSSALTAIGHGESQPVVANSSPANRAQNRRVEIIIPRGQAQEQHAAR